MRQYENFAAESKQRVIEGFAELLETLNQGLAEKDHKNIIRSNTASREAAMKRVWNEYLHAGYPPPAGIVLSLTARLELGFPMPLAKEEE